MVIGVAAAGVLSLQLQHVELFAHAVGAVIAQSVGLVDDARWGQVGQLEAELSDLRPATLWAASAWSKSSCRRPARATRACNCCSGEANPVAVFRLRRAASLSANSLL